MSRASLSSLSIVTLVPAATTAVGKVNGQEVFADLVKVEGSTATGKGKEALIVSYGVLPLKVHERARKLPAAVAAKQVRTLSFADGTPVPKGHGISRAWFTMSTSKDDVITDIDDDGQEVVELIENTRHRVTVLAPVDDKGKPYPVPMALPLIIGDAVVMVDLVRDVVITRTSTKGKTSTVKGRNGQARVKVNTLDYVADVTAMPVLKGKRWGITTEIGR